VAKPDADPNNSSELHSSTDSLQAARLNPLPSVKRSLDNPLDKPLLKPVRGPGTLAPLGAPARARLSSEDIKHDLLRQGLISPAQSPNTSQEIMDIKQGNASGESMIEDIAEEVNDFYGDHSGEGSDLSCEELGDSLADLGVSKGGASMEFRATGLSASDRSGELDPLGDADYFESAELPL